jgi:hypothetical protein
MLSLYSEEQPRGLLGTAHVRVAAIECSPGKSIEPGHAQVWSCRNRTLGKTKSRLFRLGRAYLASAKWTGIKAGCRCTYQHHGALSLYRDLSADGAAGAVSARVRTEKTCPPT